MKTLLLSISVMLLSCSQQSEETKQLKEQNDLLKKQIEKLSTKETPKPVDYASKISGTYITHQIENFDKGTTDQLPSNGLSRIFKIEPIGSKKILITETTTTKALLGATKTSDVSYKASVLKNNGVIEFKEIWENGEYEASGTFENGEFIEFTKRRSDGKIFSKVISSK